MASGINELELPSFTIQDLFIPQKLISAPAKMQTSPMASPTPPLQIIADEVIQKSATSTAQHVQQDFDVLPFASVDRIDMTPPKLRPAPLSYSSAVQTPPKRADTPELDSSGSTVSSNGSDDNFSVHRPSLSNTRTRRVKPNIVSGVVFIRNTSFYLTCRVASF